MVMNLQNIFKDIGSINSYLMIVLAFFISVSVAGVNIVLISMVLVFLWERKYKERFSFIKNNLLIYIIFLFVLIHFLGCIWSDNLSMAIDVLHRVKKLLWIPFLMMFIQKEHIKYYLQGFIFGMLLSEILTYLVWLDIVPLFKYATNEMPSPLMMHTYYTPYVALSATLLIYFLLYKKHKTNTEKLIAIFFLSTMLINLFISGGRGGQVGFFVLFFVLLLYYFRGKFFKGIAVFSISSVVLFSLAYQFVPLFQDRANKAVHEVTHFIPGVQTTSLGIRLGLNKNYYEIVKKQPWMGVGTGGYIDAYKEINKKSIYITPVTHPHNMFMLILVQFGIFGSILFIIIFVYQLYFSFLVKDDLQVIRIAFPLFFLAIMTVNWYLYTFNTMLLFIFFSAILYRKFDEKVNILD